MSPILAIQNLNKTYSGGLPAGRQGLQALKNINLEIRKGEIFALLGPNGAGKTTLINIICGIVNPTNGEVRVDGYDIIKDFRKTRSIIGLVPQELAIETFETIWHTVNFSRGLFGKPPNPAFVENVIKQLSLWDKRNSKIMTLSGGMKRRVMIAKALSHEPQILFLDEPTAGVDVNLRQDMWKQMRALKDSGVTIILTTHYIEEAEEMAERIGVINHGEIIVTDNKADLMKKLGRKQLVLDLKEPITTIPSALSNRSLSLNETGAQLIYTYDSNKDDNGIAGLLADLSAEGIHYKDFHTDTTSLEEIFIRLVKN